MKLVDCWVDYNSYPTVSLPIQLITLMTGRGQLEMS